MPYIVTLWKPVFEIVILWFVVYRMMLFFEGTRAIQVVRGIIILLIAFLIFQKFDFVILEWLFTKFFAISVVALLVIFQPEIRQGLARLGQRHLFENLPKGEEGEDFALTEIIKAAEYLCKNKVGAIIALVRVDPLTEYCNAGVRMDAQVTSELIQTIFTPNSLLHDGGLVIKGGRIVAGGCLFPLTKKEDLSRLFGTRHRAALGLSDESDAVIIVVSEERQDMSLVHKGRLYKDLGKEEIFSRIKETLKAGKGNERKG